MKKLTFNIRLMSLAVLTASTLSGSTLKAALEPAGTELITVWKTDIPGGPTSSTTTTQIEFPGTGVYVINWENVDNPAIKGTKNTNWGNVYASTKGLVIDFPEAGTYRLKTTYYRNTASATNYFGFNCLNKGDKLKLIGFEQWGTTPWTQLFQAFYGCENMEMTATDIPVLTDCKHIQGFKYMFYNAKKFNRSIEGWDYTNIKDFTQMITNSGVDCVNYDKTLIDWANNTTIPSNITTGNFVPLKYSSPAAVAARNSLINSKGWNITGDKHDPACNPTSSLDDIQDVDLLKISVDNSVLTIDCKVSDTFSIYDVSGKLIKIGKLDNNSSFELNRGVYIVKVDNKVKKVVIN